VPAGPTYAPLYTSTATGTVASFVFSGIVQTYNDLVVSCSLRGTASATTVDLLLRINNSSSNIYDGNRFSGTGTSQVTGRYTNSSFAAPMGAMVAANATANVFSAHEINFFRYSDTAMHKSVIARGASNYDTSANGYVDLVLNNYFSTVAVSTITLLPSTGSFAAGSVVTIYGIAAA
jgi:hypothetical protein